jgi:hypothetical protein
LENKIKVDEIDVDLIILIGEEFRWRLKENIIYNSWRNRNSIELIGGNVWWNEKTSSEIKL